MKRAAIASSRQATRTAGSVAKERIETYRLAGRLWWIIGKRSRAARWWRRCLDEAERMGARPELARACVEIGRRIGVAELSGISGTEYVARGRQLFVELGLAQDAQQFATEEPQSDPRHAAVA
jgi:hypothetical protein